ncbi:MAG: ATP-grasp domain-containing protein [Bacteroidia bacterium]|nr:ATP-grasp domain-containing protein [Bacteroidia bacterium]
MTDLTQFIEYKPVDGPVKIENISILNGANYFSAENVIRFRINLGEYDEIPTNKIPDFLEKLKQNLPTLYQHHCSLKKPGGFFERVKEGTLLGHVIEHIAIELQTLAGMNVGFGKTRISKIKGVFNVVFRFFDEIAGRYAGIAAVNIINSLLQDAPIDIKKIISDLIQIREERLLGFSTQAITGEAEKRGIPWLRLDKYNLVQIGTGKYRKIIQATVTGNTSLIAVEITDNKYKTASILSEYGVPIPNRIITDKVEDALAFFRKLKKPVVIKPAVGGYQGKRVSVNLKNEESVVNAFSWAAEFDEEVIVQQFVKGNTYRVLIIDFKFAAAVQLRAAHITGDGTTPIRTLIEKLNSEPVREIGDKGKLSKVEVDEETLKILELKGYNPDTILTAGEVIHLKNSGNMKLGAESADVSENIHPYNKFVCERISKILNLNVAGIDIISPDIATQVTENNACVIEVNAAPDFRMHLNPTYGEPRKVQEQYVDMLFPPGSESHIPIYSVTGSRGKTLTVKILRYCLGKQNLTVGAVCGDGIFVGDNRLKDDSGFDSANAALILKDPSVDYAVLETNVETVLQFGLGYKFADIGIVLNLDENKNEYYEYDHIKDIVDIAYAKSVVAEEVYENGFTVLNADHELICEMSERIYSKLIFISRNPENEFVQSHIKNGGMAVMLIEYKIFIIDKNTSAELLPIGQIPLVYSVREDYVTDCILASVAALYVAGISPDDIKNLLCALQL